VATHPQADLPVAAAAARGTRAVALPPGGVPRRFSLASHLTLDTPKATLLYWGGVGFVILALFAARLLPCVDYPQHLALSDIARRLADPAAPEQAEFQLNYFTYNGLFHVAVARLAMVFPIDLAGRLVVAASLVAMAAAVIALVRELGRPPAHAALFTPILFSFSVGWGFANYVLATAIAAWTLVWIARAATRPTPAALAAVALFGLACAYAHVLAMLILCVGATALAGEMAWRSPSIRGRATGPRVAGALLRTILVLAPLLIGCVYCIEVYRRQYVWDPNMYRDPTMEGSAPPLWQKAVWFGAFATDLYRDATDQVILWGALLLMGHSAWHKWRRRLDGGAASGGDGEGDAAAGPVVAPFVVLTATYFLTPMVLVGTHLIFPRLAQWAVLGAVLAVPAFPDRVEAKARRWMLALGFAAGVNTLLHVMLFAWETDDAARVIDDLPEGGAATAVIWDPATAAYRNGMLTHLAAYYAAHKHGRWAFAFARYLSVPVRFRDHTQPAWPARGWEFDAEVYDPRCKYARAFPLVIVRAPAELPTDESGEVAVRALVFKRDANAVVLLSHHGRFWAFDTQGLPEDGAL
jgi:hypothetical protein